MMKLLASLHLAAVEFDYSIIEAVYPAELNRDLLEFIHEEIDPADVYTNEEEGIKGKEDDPHITILFGIKEQKPDIQKIEQVIQNHPGMATVKWMGLGKFEAETHDVLIIQIDSAEGAELFRDFNNIYPDNANPYPDYHPHTTLAYVKKGKADKYIEQFSDAFIDAQAPIYWIRFAFNEQKTNFCPVTGQIKE